MDIETAWASLADICCPACHGFDGLTFRLVPPSRRIYENDGEHFTDHFPEQRDYHCRNCDHEWTMCEATP